MNESDVSELAARARTGDRRAFELLVRRLVRPALAAAWEFVPTREDAEDVVQDAFARCWKELGRYVYDRLQARRLPNDDAYWDDLVARSLNAAFADENPSVTAIAHGAEAWWSPATRSAYALAAAAVIALLVVLPLLNEHRPADVAGPDGIAAAIMPDQPVLRTLLSTPGRPPSADLVVQLVAMREAERGGNR